MSRRSAPTPRRTRYLLAASIAAFFALVAMTGTSSADTVDPIAAMKAQCQSKLAARPAPTGAYLAWLNNCVRAMTAPTQPPTSLPPSTVAPTTVAPTTGAPTPSPTIVTTTPKTPPATTTPPTPTPSVTTTGALLNCLPQPSRCGFPDATNTGPNPFLTPATGNRTLGNGAVLENVDLAGCVSVPGTGVIIRNSRITCNSGTYSIDVTGSATIQDTEVSCGNRGNNSTGIGEHNITILRVEVSLCENGADFDRDVTITDSYCHDLAGNDNDCIQGLLAPNITIRHNSLIADSNDNSAIEGAGLAGYPLKNVLVMDNNLLSGGGFTIYCPRFTSTGVRVTNNRFGPAVFGHSDACAAAGVVWSGNVVDSTGASLAAS